MTLDTFKAAHERVRSLVADFRLHEAHYLSAQYQEQDVRKDFIDKFWIALGWDVNHETQKNPNEQEVKVERTVGVEGRAKKADYAFLAPNFRDVRFFVEAKKPARNIDNADDYFQTVRYGWNAQATVSVLTDFEQFRILDCRLKPDVRTALDRVVRKFHYADFEDEEKFAEIYYLFSREAAHAGALERFAATLPRPTRGAVSRRLFGEAFKTVDEDFLQELDDLREELARSFKNRNPELDGEALTEATQRTLDRLVFMRFLEDKLIEPEVIVEKLGDGGSAWADFVAQSERLNRIYNGIIFKPHFIDRPDFRADERVFASVRERLSHTNTAYNFNYIPIHVLGSIYERFLGKVIVTTDKRARVEEKPEVRKAGGVYYTPEYIVRYIVAETVGKLIEGKTPAEVAELRFADIACGSGSFLLGVFDELLRHHTAYYNRGQRTRAEGKRAGCIENPDETLRLSLKQKRAILTRNIYGVDLDAQAVEVAQLSLFLKLLEEETTASARGHQMEFRETMLPDLRENIRHGNSLVGWDIAGGLFGDEEERKLYPLDFEQAFPEVMRRGGFDAIVGNPPYGAEFSDNTKAYLNRVFQYQSYQLDSYLLFLERALKDLIRPYGFLGMIIPNPWLTNVKQNKIRQFVVEQTCVREIVHFKFPVFDRVTVDTEIVVLEKREDDNCQPVISIVDSLVNVSEDPKGFRANKIVHSQKDWIELAGGVMNIFLGPHEKSLIARLAKKSHRLDTYFEINVGIKPYQTGKGSPPQTANVVKTRPFDSEQKGTEFHRQYLRGADIKRYQIAPVQVRYLKYGPWLAEPRPAANFDAPVKIFMRQTGDSLIAALDNQQLICLNNMHVLVPRSAKIDTRYFLGLINSKLLNWIHQTNNPEVGEALAEVKRTHVAQLPIRTIDFSDKADRDRHDRMVSLVEAMLAAKRQLTAARTDRDRDHYEAKCAALDRQIDALVYELYELSPAEIAIVEGRDA
ncbi:MAG TPA: TaqI-like C-terminal specificity domain-containing protein [Pyrinomonadaceae bacterium]|nr:TaqI-like C-terminal specificity domain-containing protein [Pyrinomonadaceae bacterium]